MEINKKVVELNIDDVLPNRFQPRIKFSEEAITELSNSIKEHGVIQPIVVRPIGDKFEIIAGERRYKATCMAGLQTIPAIITDLNDKDSAEVALIENVQRENLTPIEEAISYKKILDMGYITQEALAAKLGKTQSTIANKLRLLNLDDEVQEALLKEKISERHARSLLKLTDKEIQRQMLRKIIAERMPVRKADEEIDKIIRGESLEENESLNNEYNDNLPEETNNELLDVVPKDEEKQSFKFINFQQQQDTNIEEPDDINIEETSDEIKPGKFFNILNEEQTTVQNELQDDSDLKFNNLFVDKSNDSNNPLINEINEIEQSINNSTKIGTPIIPAEAVEQQPEEKIDNFEDDFESIEQFENEFVQIPEENLVTQQEYIKENNYIHPQISNFKDVLNSIRSCSDDIEKSGYSIETEEYDLEGIYQVVFKIKKED